MPRVKIADQIGALERQQSALLSKLKDSKAKAKAKKREAEDRRALIAGRAVVREFEENPTGQAAAAILGILNARLSRREDRATFNLPALLPKGSPESALPPQAAAPAPAESSGSGLFGGLTARFIGRPKQA